MAWIKWITLAMGGLAIVVLALAAYGASRWAEGTRALLAQLEATRRPSMPVRYSGRELDGLPAPVQRFFRAALSDGQAIVTAVSMRHGGSFNMSATGERWKPFVSQQRVVTRTPGFVWDAEIALLPGLPVHVHDAYVAGEGILHPAILGLFALMDLRGTGDIAQGELLRYLAEAAWYPTALLPSQGVRWEAVDEHSARATLVDGPLAATLLLRFNDQGLIDSVRAEARARVVGSQSIATPWEGRFWNYAQRNGMAVPLDGEVAWMLPEGRKPYWRGSLESVTCEFGP